MSGRRARLLPCKNNQGYSRATWKFCKSLPNETNLMQTQVFTALREFRNATLNHFRGHRRRIYPSQIKHLPSVALETLKSFSFSFSSSTWSLNRCTGQWLPSVMSCRFVSGLPSSRALVKPLSKTSLYVILSLLPSLVFWSNDFDTNAVSSSMAGLCHFQ